MEKTLTEATKLLQKNKKSIYHTERLRNTTFGEAEL
jgi:hypothetical protein